MVVEQLGEASGLYMAANNSPARDKRIQAPVAASAASTLETHLGAWDVWAAGNEKPHLADMNADAAVACLSESSCRTPHGAGESKHRRYPVQALYLLWFTSLPKRSVLR